MVVTIFAPEASKCARNKITTLLYSAEKEGGGEEEEEWEEEEEEKMEAAVREAEIILRIVEYLRDTVSEISNFNPGGGGFGKCARNKRITLFY